MQVKIHWIEFANLMSYGNAPTKIILDDSNFTIVTAKNGAGKSSVLDAICYGLYGKPYRNIKLGQLVNSTNKKALKVTIEFSVSGDVYRVVRGQKPNIFEIYKNGDLIPEDAASRDYQTFLETNILRINFKTFKQVVIIGSASYVPFMDLTAGDRRKITEKVLDISVFSSMLEIAKAKLSEYKSEVETKTYELTVLKTNLENQKTILESLKAESKTQSDDVERRKAELVEKIASNEASLASLTDRIMELSTSNDKFDSLKTAKQKIDIKIDRLDNKIDGLIESKEFYDADNCPSCGQHITDEFKLEKCNAIHNDIESYEKMRDEFRTIAETYSGKISETLELVHEHTRLLSEWKTIELEIKRDRASLTELDTRSSGNSETMNLCTTKIRELVESIISKTDSKNDSMKQLDYYKASVELLKDNGIKAKVISKFIPIMNKLINQYLAKFDMFVLFELDETFNETIKSRHRDTFTYNSFSEGEKKKIDLAILFAWREIAMSRNSVSINLLVFDETLDSSMDDESVDIFVDILSSVEGGVNTLVISHRNMVPELFDRHITVEKVRDFSIVNISA